MIKNTHTHCSHRTSACIRMHTYRPAITALTPWPPASLSALSSQPPSLPQPLPPSAPPSLGPLSPQPPRPLSRTPSLPLPSPSLLQVAGHILARQAVHTHDLQDLLGNSLCQRRAGGVQVSRCPGARQTQQRTNREATRPGAPGAGAPPVMRCRSLVWRVSAGAWRRSLLLLTRHRSHPHTHGPIPWPHPTGPAAGPRRPHRLPQGTHCRCLAG